MKKILVATTNPGKLAEISGFLKNLPIKLVSLKELGISNDVEEDGETYEENSQKKALYYAKKSDLPSISDDGGFEIDALGGKPGVHSKRWVGADSTDEKIIEHMKKVSKDLPKDNRNASFRAVVSFAMPNGKVWSMLGETKGIIPQEPLLKIEKGYPYRSFFFVPQIKKYYLEKELTEEETKEYNHRYKAIRKLIPIIRKQLEI